MTHFEQRTPDWISVEDALQRILRHARPLEAERVEVAQALGRALSEGILAKAPLPPWDNAAMDGYAVRGHDVAGATWDSPVTLRVVGETRAGAPAGKALAGGEAVRIMTGAPVPPGADSVIRVEHTDAEGSAGQLVVFSDSDGGGNIRPGGQDMREGDEVLSPGTAIGPGQVGLLAASGTQTVLVPRRPRVAILSNGDELAEASEFHRVMSGEAIPETNSPTLAAAVTLCGGIPLPLGIARDNRESILEKVEEAKAQRADVLLTSGGASMGEGDLFKRVLAEVGYQVDFWRVKMRPGTPFGFGFLPATEGGRSIPVFGLPGNPASSFVTFQIFARPFILRLAGHTRIHRPVILAQAGEALESSQKVTHFLRVRLQGDPGSPKAYLTGSQTSGLVTSQGLAQGLAVIPEGFPTVKEGGPVRVVLLDDLGLGSEEPGYMA